MLLLIVFALLTVVAVALTRYRRKGEQTAALGTMSEKWLAENRASRQ